MTSISPFDGWPLPAFKLNSKFEIVETSEDARKMFGNAGSFPALLDEGSVSKAEKFFQSANFPGPIELNFKGHNGELILCDLHCKKHSDFILNVIAVPKDDRVKKISNQLTSLRTRLNDTNYDLLLEKERTDKLLRRIRELSAPTIELGDGHLLIPFFGDLNSAKIEAIEDHILKAVYALHADTVILDLTAMHQISEEGMDYLESLLQTLKLMGTATVVTGVNPAHAKELYALKATNDMRFERSLAAVLAERRLVL